MARKRTTYTPAFRSNAVRMVTDLRLCVAEVGRRLRAERDLFINAAAYFASPPS